MSQEHFILHKVLDDLKVKHSMATIKDELSTHPEYPALSAYKDTLRLWKIQSMAVNIPPEQLEQIPYPALAHIHTPKENLVVLEKFEQDTITYSETGKNSTSESVADFTKKWSGNTLLISSSDSSGETEYFQNKQKEILRYYRQQLLRFLPLCLLVLMCFIVWNSPIALSLLLIKTLGLALSLALLTQELHLSVNWINKTCQWNERTSCESVLTSPASKIFSWLSMTDIGLMYFGGGLFACFLGALSGQTVNIISILAIINFMALPYTVFSIYYQAFIVKQWCVFCLAVQLILWVEFVFFVGFNQVFVFEADSLIYTLSLVGWSYLAIGFVWLGIKPLIISLKKGEITLKTLTRIKKNSSLFFQLLTSQNSIKIPLPSSNETKENRNHSFHSVLVINPFCNPCKSFYQRLEKLLNDYLSEEEILSEIVFLGSQEVNSKVHDLVNCFLRLQNQDKQQFTIALNDWFEWGKQQPQKWLSQYETKEDKQYSTLQFKYIDWVNLHHINQTPTFFINGFEYPNAFEIEDLKYHFDYLQKSANQTIS